MRTTGANSHDEAGEIVRRLIRQDASLDRNPGLAQRGDAFAVDPRSGILMASKRGCRRAGTRASVHGVRHDGRRAGA